MHGRGLSNEMNHQLQPNRIEVTLHALAVNITAKDALPTVDY